MQMLLSSCELHEWNETVQVLIAALQAMRWSLRSKLPVILAAVMGCLRHTQDPSLRKALITLGAHSVLLDPDISTQRLGTIKLGKGDCSRMMLRINLQTSHDESLQAASPHTINMMVGSSTQAASTGHFCLLDSDR